MKNWVRLLLVLAFYAAVFVVFTWPLATTFSSSFLAVLAPGHDTYGFIWNTWHFREQVLSGHNPYYTDWMFYPQGSWLVMHAYTPILGLFNLVLGHEILAVNTALLLSYTLSGTGAYLLARRWVRSPLLGLLAGFVFAYSPYKLQRLPEHYNLVLTATVPFYILLFLQALEFREGRWLPSVRSWGAVAGCFGLGIVTLCSDYYVLFGLLYFSLAYASWFWLRIGQINWRERRTWFWLVGILVGSHLFIRLLRVKHVKDNGGFWWGGDLVAYFMPPPTSRFLYWDWAARLYHNTKVFNTPGSHENTLFIGYALLLLTLVVSILYLARRRPASLCYQDKQGRPLAWVLLVFVLFTVPALRIYGHDRLNLPTSLVHFIPFVNNIRCPTRWIMMVGLLLPILSFSALEASWPTWCQSSFLRTGVSMLLAIAIAIEFWPQPYQQASRATAPTVFQQVAKLPGNTLVLIPMGIFDGQQQVGNMLPEHMFYQTVHRKKMPGGCLSVVNPQLFKSLDKEPVLHTLLYLQTKPDTVPPAPLTPQQVHNFLRIYKPAAFVVTPTYYHSPAHLYLRELLKHYNFQERMVDEYVLFAAPATSGID